MFPLLLLYLLTVSSFEHTLPTPHKIGFGSCNRQYETQSWEKTVINEVIDTWIWMGDAVYSDLRVGPMTFKAREIEGIKEVYDQFKGSDEYQLFVKSVPNVIGTWDDHDYGVNDGDFMYPDKYFVKDYFLDFLDVDEGDVRRGRSGVYTSYLMGEGEKSVAVYLLDVRFSQVADVDVLGEEQWKWLESELKKNHATINLFVSGLQILPSDKAGPDKWGDFTGSLQRLTHMIGKYKIEGAVLLSGDIHLGEVLVANCTHIGYPLYEFTSSGLTHSFNTQLHGSSIGEILYDISFRSALGTGEKTLDQNYGILDIDWEKKVLKFEIKSPLTGLAHFTRTINFSDLQRSLAFSHPDADCHIPGSNRVAFLPQQRYPIHFLIIQIVSIFFILSYLLSCCFK